MISYLTGKVKYIDLGKISVVTNGIGWLVNVSEGQVLEDQEVELYIHTHVRENEISLWGFKSYNELKMFNLLIDVSGVGPRTAQHMISYKGIDGLVVAILNSDSDALKVPGVGLKTSQKIILELKGKLEGIASNPEAVNNTLFSKDNNKINELTDVLYNLGYKSHQINNIMPKIKSMDLATKTLEELVKDALKLI